MTMLKPAILATSILTAGLALSAVPAAAATHCGCPVRYHHPVRHPLRHRVVYREPIAEPAPAEVVYDAPPEPIYEEAAPVYYGGPVWYGGGHYYGGHGWYAGHRGYGYGHGWDGYRHDRHWR